MIDGGSCGILVPVRGGFADCPFCGGHKLLKILPNTEARGLVLYCRKCKRELIVDINKGQCRMSQSQ